MIRYVSLFFAFCFFVLTLVPASFGCNRCGLFGNKCRFAPVVHHAAPVVAKTPDFNQNIIFNNIAPPIDLAPRGETVYGLSRALSYNAPNSALYHDNVRRALEFSGEATGLAKALDSEFYGLAATIEDGEAAATRARGFAEAFRAFQGEPKARGVGFEQVTISMKNGKVESIQRVDPLANSDQVATPRGIGGGLFATLGCTTCHSGDKPKGDLDLSGLVSNEKFQLSLQRAADPNENNRMPPKEKPRLPARKLQLLFEEAKNRGIQLPEET